MSLKPERWFPIAAAGTILNLVFVFTFASEPLHAAGHAIVALGFGLWAQRLKQRAVAARAVADTAPHVGDDVQQVLATLENEILMLRRELSETQERLDFAERMLARDAEARRLK